MRSQPDPDAVPDRYALERARIRAARAAEILRCAAKAMPAGILKYGLHHKSFDLNQVANSLTITPRRLYPSMGRMIKLGMVTKRHVGHAVVIYTLSYDGILAARCLEMLAAEGKPIQVAEDE